MPKRSNTFQRLVYRVQQTVAAPLTVMQSDMLPDRLSGKRREVDIVIRAPVGTSALLVSVECVSSKRPATIEWVERMLSKHSTLPTNQLILVSENGFTPDAETKAKQFGAVTYRLDAAVTADWTTVVGKAEQLHFAEVKMSTTSFEIQLVTTAQEWHKVGMEHAFHPNDPTRPTTANQIQGEFLRRPVVVTAIMDNLKSDGQKKATYEVDAPPNCWTTDAKGMHHLVTKFRLHLSLERTSAPIKLSHGTIAGTPVAYGKGETAFGKTELTIVEPREGQVDGTARLPDPISGELKDFQFKKPVRQADGPRIVHTETPPPDPEGVA